MGAASDRPRDDALRASILRTLEGALPGYVSCIDRERRFLYLSRTFSRPRSEVLGERVESFVVPEDRAATIGAIERAFTLGEPQTVERAIGMVDGSIRHLATRIVPFPGPDDEPLALLLTDDITERKRLNEALERSTEFRRVVIEHIPDFIVLLDRERRFVWVNRLAPGLRMEDVIGNTVDAFNSPESRDISRVTIQRAFETGAVGEYVAEAYGDGQEQAWYQVRVVPVLNEGKVENVLLVTSDITKRKLAEIALRETQEQLHQAQRLESLGQLAGGIAHDFNNLLQVMAGNLSFAQQRLAEGEAPHEELEQALRATERAAELTTHLLAIGRRQHVDTKRVDLSKLVASSVRMLRRAIPENVTLDFAPPRREHLVALDAPQFEQVLINLCVNARDAMPGGGTLTIRIEADEDRHVVMSVSDTGAGISPDNLPRVFEPFFTTKGAGSGLGLAVAAGIVAAHGGVLSAESDGKTGTTMKVRLPRAELDAEAPSSAREPSVGGSGVILVAEDESMVRAQVVRILEHSGYTVLEAEHGARAVELFREHQERIALVLLDVIMPVLDGWQAFERLDALRPGVKVLFTTGYAADVLPEDFATRGARLLSKPYRPHALLQQIRELLDEPEAR